MKMLKNHPFAIDAFFKHSMVLTFAIPKAQLAGLIPECLELDTMDDEWAFFAVALVQTKELRPTGLPRWMGSSFFLIGYRIFVRYRHSTGKSLRGLYIIKSETDSARMTFLGNVFTHYSYAKTDIQQVTTGNSKTIRSGRSCLEVSVIYTDGNVPMPKNSPFGSWKEARRFAGPMPYTFAYDGVKKTVVTVEGVRHNWKPMPLLVKNYVVGALDQLGLSNAMLASAFEMSDIPYHWKKGRIEKWR